MATLIFFPQIRFNPTQKIKTEPTMDRYPMARSVMIGLMAVASSVRPPSHKNTGTAENIQPLPREQVITITITKSKIDLAPSVDQSPEIPS